MDDSEIPLNLDRLRRISEFWNWLPAYRAVAETEHVRTAAERLRVSPSALSRSIGLLEENLGEQLFDREGRGIKLNRAGREFLAHLRLAMRLIDDAVDAIESTSFTGALHLCAPDDLMGRLWDGLAELRNDHPELVVQLHHVPSREVNSRLLRGSLDLVFDQEPIPGEGLEVERFMESSNAVYCGTGHMLAARDDLTSSEVLAHAFVAGVDVDGRTVDGWPPDIERRVAATVPRLQAAVEACAFGGLLAALPSQVAQPYCERGLLKQLRRPLIAPSTFYVVRRTAVREYDRNAAVVQFLRRRLNGHAADLALDAASG